MEGAAGGCGGGKGHRLPGHRSAGGIGGLGPRLVVIAAVGNGIIFSGIKVGGGNFRRDGQYPDTGGGGIGARFTGKHRWMALWRGKNVKEDNF